MRRVDGTGVTGELWSISDVAVV